MEDEGTWLNKLESRLQREPTPQEREEEAQHERWQQLLRKIDDVEARIGRSFKDLDASFHERQRNLQDQLKDTARQVRQINDAVLVLMLAGVLYMVYLAFGEWAWVGVIAFPLLFAFLRNRS